MTERQFGKGVSSYSVAGDGPLIILSHALGPRVWGWPLGRLAETCTVVTLEDMSAQMAVAFRHIARDLGFESFSLCAWSMAGGQAVTYAASQPPELKRLILVDIAGLGGPLSERGEHDAPPASTDPVREWARAMWRGRVHNKDLDTSEYEELTYQRATATAKSFQRNLEANRQAMLKPLLGRLEHVKVPTLVMAGRRSAVLGPEAGVGAVKRLLNGRLLVFEHSAHALPLEEPERFQDEVAVFVRSS